MAKKLTLISGQTDADADGMPAGLGKPGAQLWANVMREYQLENDIEARALLEQACRALDRAERCAAEIAIDGEVVRSRGKPAQAHSLLRHELGNRQFSVRCLQRLGINYEPVKPLGRPPSRGY